MEQQLNIICDIAEQMLKSGAEVHRVEDSVARMCSAIGAARADVFIITSSIVVTIFDGEQCTYTQTRRIDTIGTDMEKLHRLNNLSRRICNEEMSDLDMSREYEEIVRIRTYPVWLEFMVYGFIGAAFCLFFGGTVLEAPIAFVIGVYLRLVTYLSDKLHMGRIFCRFVCSFSATALAYSVYRFGGIPTPDYVIIGNIMVLIPGIGLTNALRDLFVGDSIAGLLRFVEAVLTALAIAAGHFLFITLFKGVLL